MTSFFKSSLFRCAFLLSFTSFTARAQEVGEVPLGAIPTQYNGGFAGEAGCPRVNLVTGLLSNRYYKSGYSAYAAYDQFVPAIRSGIAVTAGYDRSHFGGGQWGNLRQNGWGTYFAAAIAPKFSLRGKVTLSPSLDVALGTGREFAVNAGENKEYRNTALRSRVGLLLNTEKFYAGYSVHLVDRHYWQGSNDTTRWRNSGRIEKFTSYWQFGYTFGRGEESKFSFTPQLVFTTGTRLNSRRGYVLFSPVDFNLNFRYKKVIWGVNLTGWHVGWQTDRLRIMLSDNLEYLRREPGYAANLAVRYSFKE